MAHIGRGDTVLEIRFASDAIAIDFGISLMVQSVSVAKCAKWYVLCTFPFLHIYVVNSDMVR